MILFTILLTTLLILMVFTLLAIGAGGAAFIIVFGDVIVCMALIVWIIKHLFGRKKKG